MSPVDRLGRHLQDQFPDARIELGKSDDPAGFQFLDLSVDRFDVNVEWKPECGFGISSFGPDTPPLEGLYDAPDEWYRQEQAAFHRIVCLVLERRETKPRRARMADIRAERGLSQEDLSEHLSIKQSTYSKLERREDVKVSSLRRVVEAMGGKLTIQAVFPDTKDVREITFP